MTTKMDAEVLKRAIKETMDNYDLALNDVIRKVKRSKKHVYTKDEIIAVLKESKMNYDKRMKV